MNELALAFTLGLGSAASPCLLPLYPGFIAYLAGNSRSIAGTRASGLLGLLVLLGVLSAMVVVAVVLGLLSRSIGSILAYLIPVVDGILILLGLLLVAGRNPFARLPGARVPVLANPYGQAYVYGLMLGPLALPCAGPPGQPGTAPAWQNARPWLKKPSPIPGWSSPWTPWNSCTAADASAAEPVFWALL